MFRKRGKKALCLILLTYFLISTVSSVVYAQDDENPIVPDEGEVRVWKDVDYYIQELPNSIGGGFEPHVMAGPSPGGAEEWYYIDSPTGIGPGGNYGNLWISKDGGYTWEDKTRQGSNALGSGDTYTVITRDGTIYFTDLWLWTSTIYTSKDGGNSWRDNPVATVTRLGDRQWLRSGPTVGLGTQAETVYMVYNDIPYGLIIQKSRWTSQGFIWEQGNGRQAVTSNVGSRDYFAVDKQDGTVYLPNKESSGIVMYVSTDGAESFDSYPVLDTGDDIQNIFIAADVDRGGNVYLTWSDQLDIYLGMSQDKGKTWNITKVTEGDGTRVFPWVVGGDDGRIGLTWYETPATGGISDELSNASWVLNTAIVTNTLSASREYTLTTLDIPDMHIGSISTGGLGGESDRDLGDFFTCDLNNKGQMILVTGKDGDDGDNVYLSTVVFAKQLEGPFLLEQTGPEAMFDASVRGMTVYVDGFDSFDRNGGGIVEYVWDWGDSSNGTGMEASHTYNKTGEYDVTLKVINKGDMRHSTTQTVKADVEPMAIGMEALLIIPLLLVGVAGYYLYSKKKQNESIDEELEMQAGEETSADAAGKKTGATEES